MSTLTLQIPDKAKLDAGDVQIFLSAKLYEAGKLTLGQAAEMAGMGKINFADILIDYGVSLLNYPISEIKRDAQFEI